MKKPRYEREIIVNFNLYKELQHAINDETIILGILQTKEYNINYVVYTEDGE